MSTVSDLHTGPHHDRRHRIPHTRWPAAALRGIGALTLVGLIATAPGTVGAAPPDPDPAPPATDSPFEPDPLPPVPATDVPATDDPVTDGPATDDPATELPAAELPAPIVPDLASRIAAWAISADGDDVALTGSDRELRIDAPIAPGWQVTSAVLQLDHDVPEIVRAATLGIEVNGEFVVARILEPGSGILTIPVEPELFRTGANRVDVSATIDLHDDELCPDPRHPARRITIGGGSRLLLDIAPTPSVALRDFPEALEPVGNIDRTLVVRLVAEPSGPELTAAAALVAAVRDGAADDVETVIELGTIEVGTRADTTDRDQPMIVIGTAEDLDIELGAAPGHLELERLEHGSPRLVVTGRTPEDVLAAARTITDPNSRSRLDEPVAEVDSEPARDFPSPGSEFTLADLGASERTLHGPGADSTGYGFEVPVAETPASMIVSVDAVRSASSNRIDAVSVIVNGRRAGNVPFDDVTGTTGEGVLGVPAEYLRPGANFVRVEAEFQGVIPNCETTPPDQEITVNSESRIELLADDGPVEIDLDDVPYLLRDLDDAVDLTIVLPDDADGDDLRDAIDIAVLLGNDEWPAAIAFPDDLDGISLAGQHLVVLGEFDAQPLLAQLTGATFGPGQWDVPDQQDLPDVPLDGVVEMLANPDDPSHVVITVTGRTADGADLARRALLDNGLRGELEGRATLVGSATGDTIATVVVPGPVFIERGTATPVADPGFTTSSASGLDALDPSSTLVDGATIEVGSDTSTNGIDPSVYGPVGLVALAAALGGWIWWRRRTTASAH